VKVAVLGAGVIGVTAAQAIAADGHTVTVIDRQPGPAMETSFANGGQISASHTPPWATAQMPLKALSLMFRRDAPLRINPIRWDPALWGWCFRFLTNCTSANFSQNMQRALRLSLYSREVLRALRQRYNLQYDQTTGGLLYLYHDKKALGEAKELALWLSDRGITQNILSHDGVLAEEPALHYSNDRFEGGILSPNDETGDAHVFSKTLTSLAKKQGVDFRFDTIVKSMTAKNGNIVNIETSEGIIEADAFVISLGSDTARLLRPLGLSVPIYPAKGYSLTAEITDIEAAPKHSITDESRFMVITRIGNRIRAGGTAELVGWDRSINPNRMQPIVSGARALFPKAADYNQIQAWAGLRPATPDSVPIIGSTPYENLFINAGHGTLGWTMAAGSAQVIADLISSRTPEIDLEGLCLSRFI